MMLSAGTVYTLAPASFVQIGTIQSYTMHRQKAESSPNGFLQLRMLLFPMRRCILRKLNVSIFL